MKTILEYLVNNHVKNNKYFDTICKGDYYVIEYERIGFNPSKVMGKFKNWIDKHTMFSYFEIGMGNRNQEAAVFKCMDTYCASDTQLRYPNDEELEILKMIDRETNILDKWGMKEKIGTFDYKTNTFNRR